MASQWRYRHSSSLQQKQPFFRSVSPPRFIPTPIRRRLRSTRGFTLVEIGMVTLIVGVMASLSMPAIRYATKSARAGALVNDLRVFAAAFQSVAQQNGEYPPDAGIGVMPTGMAGSLGNTSWLQTTPVGGHYNWDHNCVQAGVLYRAAIGVRSTGSSSVTTDLDQLLEADRRIDDGNLATGNFFLGAGNEPVFIIER